MILFHFSTTNERGACLILYMKLNKLIIAGLATAFLSACVTAKPEGGKKEKGEKGEKPAKREFAEIDADASGELSLAEFSDGAKSAEKAAKRFEHMDADANGSVTKEEFDSAKPSKAKGKGKGKDKKEPKGDE